MVNELIIAKVVSMLVLGIFAWICGLIPLKLKGYFDKMAKGDSKKQRIFDLTITIISCFGAGVILTTCLTHMLPDANEELAASVEAGHISASSFPLVEILILVGFFLVYLVEELTNYFMIRWYGDKPPNEESPNGDHGHSHGIDVDIVQSTKGGFKALLRCFIIIVALGLHSVFEGIAIGLGKTPKDVWFLFFAIASHKFVVAFVIGMQFVTSGLSKFMIILLISIFSVISPIGIAIGLGLTFDQDNISGSQGVAITVLNGLAAGTLLYVVFFEVLEKERAKQKYGLVQVSCIILGFLFMLVVNVIENASAADEEAAAPFCSIKLSDYSTLTTLNFTCENGVLKIN